jgi:hypothetical protein
MNGVAKALSEIVMKEGVLASKGSKLTMVIGETFI